MYRPGSKYKLNHTGGGEYSMKSNMREYKGPYIELSDGTLYSGNDISQVHFENELVPLVETLKKMGGSSEEFKYNIIKSNVFEFIKNTKPIMNTKSFPTKKDYNKGKMDRYFTRRRNNLHSYIEIDKKTYGALISKSGEHNHKLYEPGTLIWSLRANAAEANNASIKKAERLFPGVRSLYPNLNEFYIPFDFESKGKSQEQAIQDQKEKPVRETTDVNDPKYQEPIIPSLEGVQKEMLDQVRQEFKQKQKIAAKNLSKIAEGRALPDNSDKSEENMSTMAKKEIEKVTLTPKVGELKSGKSPDSKRSGGSGGGMSSGGGGGGY